MRNTFDEQLAALNNMLIEMGALIEQAIQQAITALEKQDTELAKQVIIFDDRIDQKERDVEALCLKLLLRQQPVASDLRLISSVLKMITDMERIGDHASDISEITLILAKFPDFKILEHVPQMAEVTTKMVTQSIDAFVKKDLELAQTVIKSDDIVDELFMTVRKEWMQFVRDEHANGEQAADLLMIAKYFERIGDHAVNIAEWVIFSITGEHVKR
jgi:phosphate transport system protein